MNSTQKNSDEHKGKTQNEETKEEIEKEQNGMGKRVYTKVTYIHKHVGRKVQGFLSYNAHKQV